MKGNIELKLEKQEGITIEDDDQVDRVSAVSTHFQCDVVMVSEVQVIYKQSCYIVIKLGCLLYDVRGLFSHIGVFIALLI